MPRGYHVNRRQLLDSVYIPAVEIKHRCMCKSLQQSRTQGHVTVTSQEKFWMKQHGRTKCAQQKLWGVMPKRSAEPKRGRPWTLSQAIYTWLSLRRKKIQIFPTHFVPLYLLSNHQNKSWPTGKGSPWTLRQVSLMSDAQWPVTGREQTRILILYNIQPVFPCQHSTDFVWEATRAVPDWHFLSRPPSQPGGKFQQMSPEWKAAGDVEKTSECRGLL